MGVMAKVKVDHVIIKLLTAALCFFFRYELRSGP